MSAMNRYALLDRTGKTRLTCLATSGPHSLRSFLRMRGGKDLPQGWIVVWRGQAKAAPTKAVVLQRGDSFGLRSNFEMTHPTEILKIWPEFFQAYLEGRKPFEIRQQDRPYKVGYLFRLKEWDPEAQAFTGRVSGLRRITYLTDFAIKPGFVAFAHEAAGVEEVDRG